MDNNDKCTPDMLRHARARDLHRAYNLIHSYSFNKHVDRQDSELK